MPRATNIEFEQTSFCCEMKRMNFWSNSTVRTLVTLVAVALSPLVAKAATSISQFGITWTFDKDYTVGQYANGDYWVIGPVTITAISPASEIVAGHTRNGSMVNPVAGNGASHGFDSNIGGYLASLNVGLQLPLNLKGGSSLISTSSNDAQGNRAKLTDGAVLTVVSAAPPANSFRPPYCGTNKQIWSADNLDFTILQKVAKLSSTPDLSSVTAQFTRPWIEVRTNYEGREMHPSNNQPEYGRDMARTLGDGLLSLQLNYTDAQKKLLYIRLVQYGLDVYGAALTGCSWVSLAGHNPGRKMPMMLAGAALHDSAILDWADARKHKIFSEDLSTWYVTTADVGRPLYHADGRVRVEYLSQDVGLAESGEQHAQDPTRDGRNWEDLFYRDIMASSYIPHALTARMMGLQDQWGWPAFFDYCDRYFPFEIKVSNPIMPFHRDMWFNYRGGKPPTTARIQITSQ